MAALVGVAVAAGRGVRVAHTRGTDMRVIFSAPTYGASHTAAVRSQRAAIMYAANHGVTWVGDASPDRVGIEDARNIVAGSVLQCEDSVDGVFWADDDVVLPPSAIATLVGHGQDFVTGVVCQRIAPHWPLIGLFDGTLFKWASQIPPDTLGAVDGCGFGCVYTSMKLLRALGDNPFARVGGFGEDLSFCRQAMLAGFQLWVDTTVQCGHLPDAVPVTLETFKAKRVHVSEGMTA